MRFLAHPRWMHNHALVWRALDTSRLSEPARRLCDEIPQTGGVVSAISLWEIGLKVKRGQLDLGLELDDYVKRLRSLKGLEIVAVDVEHWLANLRLPWDHPTQPTGLSSLPLFCVMRHWLA